MKRMFVCGDSYMSPVVQLPNTHLSEIVAKHFGYELISYARGGMSNLGICLQIEAAIQEKADFILLNTTSHDRIEIPFKGDTEEPYNVQHILYREHTSVSSYSTHVNNGYPKLISDTLHCLLAHPHIFFDLYGKDIPNIKEIREAVKHYFEFMYDEHWKKKIDLWGIYTCLHKLKLSNIPFLVIFSTIEIKNYCNWLDFTNFILESPQRFEVPKEDPGYHISVEDQKHIAKTIIQHITEFNILDT